MNLLKSDPTLLPKLAGLHLLLGMIAFGLGQSAKDFLPHSLGLQPVIQLPFAYFSSVMFPMGSLLALGALLFQGEQRRVMLSYHLGGVLFALIILGFYFFAYMMSQKILTFPNEIPNILPKLAENAANLPKESQRIFQAQYGYRLYGVIIAYRHDDSQVSYYVPTEEDKKYLAKQRRIEFEGHWYFSLLKRTSDQFPYLFALYAATYMATFLVGGLWLILRMPPSVAIQH